MNARTKAALFGLLAAMSGAATDYLMNLSGGVCPPAAAEAKQ